MEDREEYLPVRGSYSVGTKVVAVTAVALVIVVTTGALEIMLTLVASDVTGTAADADDWADGRIGGSGLEPLGGAGG